MRKFLLIALCLGFAGGCVSPAMRFHVAIDSINNNEPTAGKSCVITSGMKDVSTDDLQFKEFATYVKQALALKGYTISEDTNTADINVFLGYGISEPSEHQYSYAMPIFGQTGVSSASTYGSISGGNIMATTTYTPSYGVTGAVPMTGSYITYTRQISLLAYDLKYYRETKKEKQLWKTEIVSTGSSGDLRFVFPLLLGAGYQYIGDNTGAKVNVDLGLDDERVSNIANVRTYTDTQASLDKKYESPRVDFSLNYPTNWDVQEDFTRAFPLIKVTSPAVDHSQHHNVIVITETIKNAQGKLLSEVKNNTLADYKNATIKQFSSMRGYEILETGDGKVGNNEAFFLIVMERVKEQNIKVKVYGTIVNSKVYSISLSIWEPDFDAYLPQEEGIVKTFNGK